jgi:hypothetical protein
MIKLTNEAWPSLHDKLGSTFVPKNTGWINLRDIKAEAKQHQQYIHSVGFYVGIFHGYVVLAAEFNQIPEMLNWGACTYIPVGCIKSKEKLT